MDIILILVLCALMVVLIVAIVVIIKYLKKDNYRRRDIHISGGVDIETGQISTDNNYFKGITGSLEDTIVAGYDYRKNLGFKCIIYDLNKSTKTAVEINNNIIIGRTNGDNVYQIIYDRQVSQKHCKLYVQDKKLFVCDMGSLNHTILNGEIITTAVECRNGDVIKVGNTMLKIVY